MFRKQNGSITVFICIVLAVIIPLSCILIDLARFSMAKKQAESAVRLCAESMLAAYDRQLKEQYGLFSLYPRDVEAMEQEIYDLLSQNLNNGVSVEGFSDLYGFKIRKVEVIPFYNLSEPYVLQQQVAEFMKYRAPIQFFLEFYEKIKVMMGLMQESDMIEKKMSLDKLMNDIRSKLVNIYFMLKLKLVEINRDTRDKKKALKGEVISAVKHNTAYVSENLSKAAIEAQPIREAQLRYEKLYEPYQKAKSNLEGFMKMYSEEISRLESLEQRLSELKGQLANATGSAVTTIQTNISNLEDDIEAARSEFSFTETYLYQAQENFSAIDAEITPIKTDMDKRLDNVIQCCGNALSSSNESICTLNKLERHISRHYQFHNDLIAMIDEIKPQLNELDTKSQSLKQTADKSDSSVSDRIKSSLEKQLKCISKESFEEILAQLKSNLARLEAWKNSIQSTMAALEKAAYDIEVVSASARAVKNEPQNLQNQYSGYSGVKALETQVADMEKDLKDLNTLDKMKGHYAVPAYELVPLPNDKEEEAFAIWYYQKYGAEDPEVEKAPAADDKEMKELREGMGSFAGEVGKKGAENENAGDGSSASNGSSTKGKHGTILELIANRFQLPSLNGRISSEEALKRIGGAIRESENSQLINESPFDRPVEGLDTVNENDKNFFDYELERITAIIEIIRQAVSKGMESLVESFYMNEYIVSAFKCAATQDNAIEHDIGWGRPLEDTYFKKGEVEYIIFGKGSEDANIGCSQRSIFAIRLVFNLLHVYTDPQKLSTTLSLAATIAGWTIFGVPLVQNFLLIAWAGLESYVDSEILIKGGRVPLIKTSASWYLAPERLPEFLKNTLLTKVKEYAKEQIEEKVNDVSKAVEETVTGIIDAKIDDMFAPFEEGLQSVASAVDDTLDRQISSLINDQTIRQYIRFDGIESFTRSLPDLLDNFKNRLSDQLKSMTQDKLAGLKSALKERVKNLIFKSSLYLAMVEKIKALGGKVVDKGLTYIEGKIDSVFGTPGKSTSNNIAGRLIMMDYTDYLRLMLLAVPADKKALRAADLMQLNMQKVSGNKDLKIGQYNTYIFIKVELDMDFWFLPEALYKNRDSGMICVQWSQGY